MGLFHTCAFASSDDLAPIDKALRTAIEQALSAPPESAWHAAAKALGSESRSRLAHWLTAQMALVRAGEIPQFDMQDRDLLAEARARMHVRPKGHLPASLVILREHSNLGRYTLLVDLSVARLFVVRINSDSRLPEVVDEFYTTLGLGGGDKRRKGDQKTPLGAYRLLKGIDNPRPDGFLGKRAITLDYPNPDDRANGRTGSSIWIHGVPEDIHVRPPRASDGCLAISNADMERLEQYVDFGKTYIVISARVDWMLAQQWLKRQSSVLTRLATSNMGSDLVAIFDPGPQRSVVMLRKGTRSAVSTFLDRKQFLLDENGPVR
jgi:hypothetical protein